MVTSYTQRKKLKKNDKDAVEEVRKVGMVSGW